MLFLFLVRQKNENLSSKGSELAIFAEGPVPNFQLGRSHVVAPSDLTFQRFSLQPVIIVPLAVEHADMI